MNGLSVILNNHKLYSAVKATAIKRRLVEVWISGAEKWNYDGDTDVPGPDGHFDVEGHTWTDIYGFFQLSPYRFDTWKCIASDIKDNAEEIYDWLKSRRYRYGLRLKPFLVNPFRMRRSGWTWTVASFDVLRGDVADEKAFDEVYGDCKDYDDGRDWLDRINNPTKEQRERTQRNIALSKKYYEEISKEEIIEHLKKDYLQVASGMWVSAADPTVIYADEDVYPFDMKSGWSDSAICALLQVWVTECGKLYYPVVQTKDLGGNKVF